MPPTPVKHLVAACTMLLSFSMTNAQQPFFVSSQHIAEDKLQRIYSSISVHGNLLLFGASDFTLYAYDKNTGQLKWESHTDYKSNQAPFVSGSFVFAPVYSDRQELTAILDTATGKIIKKLPIGPLETKPFVKNGLLYGTAIYDGGCLFAYDMAKDTVLWWRFLAHGVSNQPYYFENSIIANAESSNWFGINYNGQLTDTTCKVKSDIFVQDIPCIRNFSALTHDQKEITESLLKKLFEEDIESVTPVYSSKYTFLLQKNRLAIIGDKLKVKANIDIYSLSDTLEIDPDSEGSVLKADDERVWLYQSNYMLVYNHKSKKLEQAINLSAWEPHQVMLEGNRIWLISRKDGLLYGFNY